MIEPSLPVSGKEDRPNGEQDGEGKHQNGHKAHAAGHENPLTLIRRRCQKVRRSRGRQPQKEVEEKEKGPYRGRQRQYQ